MDYIWFDTIKKIESKNPPDFQEKEIWFCYLGKNIGTEQNGSGKNFQRPVIIIKKFNNMSAMTAPLTSIIKDGKYYFTVNLNNKKSSIIISQIRFLSAKRLLYKIGKINDFDYIKLKRKIRKNIF